MNALQENQRGNFQAVRRVFGPIAGNVERSEPGRELLPGIRSLPAFGHAAGHTAFTVETGGQKLLYWGNTTHIAGLFVRNPDRAMMFDADAEAARQRLRLRTSGLSRATAARGTPVGKRRKRCRGRG